MRPLPALLVAALAVVLAGCKATAPPPPEPIRPVKVMQVQPRRDAAAFVLPGEVRARWETRLAFRVGGKLVHRAVEVGQVVAAGDLLGLLDDTDLRLAVQTQEATLAAAQADARLALREEQRVRKLFEGKLTSQSQLDQAQGAREAAAAQAHAAQERLAQVRRQAEYARLVADEAGVVIAVEAEEGQVLAAGQTLLRVARLEAREVVVAVAETRLPALRAAERLEVTLNAVPGRVWSGRLRELAPAADAASRTFAARVAIAAADEAVALGMSAQVRVVAPGAEVLAVPLTALSSKDETPRVWTLDPATQQVRRVAVTLGPVRGDAVVVLDGLAPGDRVVTAGAHLLREGLTVRPLPAQEAP